MCSTNRRLLDATNLTDVAQIDKLERLVFSIAKESPYEYIHINIITYEKEVSAFKEAVESGLTGSKTITYDFISLDNIQKRFRRQIQLFQNYTTKKTENKYKDISLHIRPLYSRIFAYNQIAVLDIDMEFRCSFENLYKQFEKFNSHQILAMAYDQSPWYRYAFKNYRKQNNGTLIGEPYPGYQGFNTGVILFNLEKARQSKEYNYHLTYSGYKYLFEKYNMSALLGDQDFFTLLGAEYPDLFYILDCSYNRQTGPLHFFFVKHERYYLCEKEIRILHKNSQKL
ncbi:xyloside xylosyltransferase 1-like [Artemia franciscana]|uniref:xyloside xylosyltransferase 1-like n=1 Tax=Artemia franciscana TaxID=6661 RepID=UPI0032DB4BD6